MAQNSRDLDRLDSDTSSEGTASIARPDSEGWEDAEPDEEVVQVKDFFSDKTFPDATSMIKYCAAEHGFDFLKVVQDFGGYVSFLWRTFAIGAANSGLQVLISLAVSSWLITFDPRHSLETRLLIFRLFRSSRTIGTCSQPLKMMHYFSP